MSKDFQFTRYLYEKTEVEYALMLAILHKNTEEALFWVYELYYSGFENELVSLLWNIYYDFYASLNPSFETYLLKKTKELTSKETNKERTPAQIIQNFLIRPFNLDVFMLKQIQENFVISEPPNNILQNLLKEVFDKTLNMDYLLYYVFAHGPRQSAREKLEEVIHYLDIKTPISYKNIKSNSFVPLKTILLAKIMHLYGLKQNVKMGKKLYIHIEPEEVIMYETIQVDLTLKEGMRVPRLPAYKILPLAAIYSINSMQMLGVFGNWKRQFSDIRDAYLNDWLYYASKSPVWIERIQHYGGDVNQSTKKIEFQKEEQEEEFYTHYGYEPDEQSKEIQEKSIQKMETCTVKQFYESLNNGKNMIFVDMDYLEQISTFSTFSTF
jgi:hypothetical protein